MEVKRIEDKDLWDRSIETSPYGTLFHKWDFLKIMEKYSGCELFTYGIYRKEELSCQFPLFVKSSLGIKMAFSPPPGLPVTDLGFAMGPVYDKLKQRRKETYINSILDDMEAEIKKIPAKFVHISTVNGFVDMRPYKWNGYDVQMHYTYAIDLNRPLEMIEEGMDGELKQLIRAAENRRLSIRPEPDFDVAFRTMRDLYGRQGEAPPIAIPAFLKDAAAAFPDNIRIDYLYDGDQIVDMAVNYRYKDRFVLWIWNAGAGLQYSGYMAWEYIKVNKAKGLCTLEIPGASLKMSSILGSKLNASLVYNFSITKKDLIGGIAEKFYRNSVKT
ncbi:MAG TPA: GNAT family N-acetyltransferase [Methanocella sp.]|uniref:GNAT family N-acetyltransferase n=1 Tax=Methanocella sp. TaxID=2052833 RepID=UPI002C2ED8F3|nr:GNAT family N-acetyltransferase [Methanocella sp.]HTY91872.1 GNAT family N-acetyltransferase [Methanocella sp.]